MPLFICGVFFCNSVPHPVAGLWGNAFPTSFAKPIGVGNSPALVSFLWGLSNVLVGAMLIRSPDYISTLQFIFAIAGAAAMGFYLSVHSARVESRETR